MQLNVRYKLTVSITNYFVIIIFEIYDMYYCGQMCVFHLPLLLIFSNDSFSFKISFNKVANTILSSGDQCNYMYMFTKNSNIINQTVYKNNREYMYMPAVLETY